MTNSKLLLEMIQKSGLKLGFIAKKLKTSYAQLKRKINNERPFTAEDMQILCDLLNIKDLKLKDRIFFACDVEEYSTNT